MSQTSRRDLSASRPTSKSSIEKLEYNRKRYWEKREQLLAQHREYYKKNRDKLLQSQKEYVKNNLEKTQAYRRKWHQENKEEVIKKATKWNKENKERRLEIQAGYRSRSGDYIRAKNKGYRMKYRQLVIGHYSHGKNICACCGEKMIQFLSIDHINGDGNKHRKEINSRGGHHFYYWLIRNNYPEGFQVLCFNCNHAKHIHGVCPHQAPLDTFIPL